MKQLNSLWSAVLSTRTIGVAIFTPILFFLFMAMGKTQAQTFCTTPPTSTNMGNNAAFGNMGATGPYHMRIYLHVIRRTDGTGGQTYADVLQALSYLDMDFNPHGIFFEWDGCIDYIDDDAWFPGPNTGIYSVNNHYDGIDIYLFDDGASAGGRANGVGSSSEFWVSGSYWNPPFGSLVKSHVISHEMGHVLFLWHTHHGCETGNWELTDGSNCGTAGDFVCDTPADPHLGFNVDPGTCEWSGVNFPFCPAPEPLSLYVPDEHIIMAYTHPDCMEYFTAGQGQRMCDAISTLPFLQATLVEAPNLCACEEEDIHIYESTTYNTNMGVNGNIYIHTGAQLTITSTIQFGKDKGIIVERGAKLYVNGGTLTKCPLMEDWRGINVEGNSGLPQPDAFSMPSNNEAGVVLMTMNAHVEWARNAISTTRYNQGWNSPYWGGLVHCENTTFVKNRRVAEFMKYDIPNNSMFINCTMDAVDIGNVGVTIWDTDNVTFNRCRFYNMPRQGILAYDAGVVVKDGNDFHHNWRGISSRATYPFAASLEVGDLASDPNYFLDNWFHIESNASNKLDGLKIINNEFFESNTAIWLIGPSKYRIENNSFDETTAGVYSYRTGSLNNNQHNYIRSNAISASSGIIARGENRELQFLCNDFSANWDFRVAQVYNGGPQGEIRERQGNPAQAAGNCFTNLQQIADITTENQTLFFKYYVYGEEPCKTPVTPGNYLVVPALAEDCGEGGFPENPTYEDYVSVKDQIAVIQNNGGQPEDELSDLMEEKEYILLYLVGEHLDAGNTEAAVQLLDEENTTASKLMKYGVQVNAGNYTEALTTLNALPGEVAEMDTFRQVQYINLDRLQQGLLYELSESDSLFLESIAVGDMGIKGYARSILGLLFGREFDDEYIEEGAGPRSSQPGEDKPVARESIEVYPNPTEGGFTIAIPDGITVASLKVTSVLGQTVYREVLPEKTPMVSISGQDWHSGVYILNLFDTDGKVVHSELLFMNK